jgi:prevent-host-death family protein
METVGAYEAKTHLPKLLERVRRGERITIAKHGTPIAVLQPYAPEKQHDVKSAIRKIRKFRQKNRLAGLSIRDLIESGRR